MKREKGKLFLYTIVSVIALCISGKIYNKIKKTGGMVYGKDQKVAQNTCYDADSSYDAAECTVSYGICRCHK